MPSQISLPALRDPGRQPESMQNYYMWNYIAAHNRFKGYPKKKLKQIAEEITEVSKVLPFTINWQDMKASEVQKLLEPLKLKYVYASADNLIHIRGVEYTDNFNNKLQVTSPVRYTGRKLIATMYYLVDALSDWGLRKQNKYSFIRAAWILIQRGKHG
jgi:hypothetical protein